MSDSDHEGYGHFEEVRRETEEFLPWPGNCQACGARLDPPNATSCPACGRSDIEDD